MADAKAKGETTPLVQHHGEPRKLCGLDVCCWAIMISIVMMSIGTIVTVLLMMLSTASASQTFCAMPRGSNPIELPPLDFHSVSELPQCGSFDRMRIVVNTGTGYETSTIAFLQSLQCAGFTDWSKVIVVQSGDEVEAPPQKMHPSAVLVGAVPAAASLLDSVGEVVVIRTRFMNLDLTAYSLLYMHIEHALVKAPAYMYVLGTSLVAPDFCKRISPFLSRDWSGAQYHTAHIPASNIGVLSRGVVERYMTNFDVPVTKHQGLLIEFGQPVPDTLSECNSSIVPKCMVNEDASERCLTKRSETVYPVGHFANVTYFWGDREGPGLGDQSPTVTSRDVDLYGLGKKRRAYLYRNFGLIKMIAVGGADCHNVDEDDKVKQARSRFADELCQAPIYDDEGHVCPAGSVCINCASHNKVYWQREDGWELCDIPPSMLLHLDDAQHKRKQRDSTASRRASTGTTDKLAAVRHVGNGVGL